MLCYSLNSRTFQWKRRLKRHSNEVMRRTEYRKVSRLCAHSPFGRNVCSFAVVLHIVWNGLKIVKITTNWVTVKVSSAMNKCWTDEMTLSCEFWSKLCVERSRRAIPALEYWLGVSSSVRSVPLILNKSKTLRHNELSFAFVSPRDE